MLSFTKLLEEVSPDDIDVSSLKPRDTLNPKIWSGYILLDDARSKFMDYADKYSNFIKFHGKSKFEILDIIITGSNANFNWSEYSDIDIHLELDYKSVSDDYELVSEYLFDKKTLWSLKYTSEFKDIPVELYAGDVNESYTKGAGVYSLLKNEWIQKPNRSDLNVDLSAVKDKAADIMNQIDQANTTDQISRIRDRLWRMRNTALSKYGEFAIENLAYKILRRNGAIDSLRLKYEAFEGLRGE